MSCHHSCVVKAPVEKVWALLRNFHDMSWAKGVIETLEPVGDRQANQVGARRLLNGAIHETLAALDDADRRFEYTIDDGPTALSKQNVGGYVGVVQVRPVTLDDTTFVEWTSSWKQGGQGVQEFCDPVYRALLACLQRHCAAPRAH